MLAKQTMLSDCMVRSVFPRYASLSSLSFQVSARARANPLVIGEAIMNLGVRPESRQKWQTNRSPNLHGGKQFVLNVVGRVCRRDLPEGPLFQTRISHLKPKPEASVSVWRTGI